MYEKIKHLVVAQCNAVINIAVVITNIQARKPKHINAPPILYSCCLSPNILINFICTYKIITLCLLSSPDISSHSHYCNSDTNICYEAVAASWRTVQLNS